MDIGEQPRKTTVNAKQVANTMNEIFAHLRAEMTRARLIHEESANRKRRTTLNFQPGDLVFLDSRNINTRRPSRKLEHKKLDPFPISRQWVSVMVVVGTIR